MKFCRLEKKRRFVLLNLISTPFMLVSLVYMFGFSPTSISLPTVDAQVDESKILLPPENFTVEYYQDQQLILLWDNQDRQTSEFIVRKSNTSADELEDYAIVSSLETSYIDTVKPDQVYFYQVVATSAGYVPSETPIFEIVLEAQVDQSSSSTQEISTANSIANEQNNQLEQNNVQSRNAIDEITLRLGGQTRSFWLNLFALNIFGIGIILLLYQLTKYFVSKSSQSSETDHLKGLKASLGNSWMKLKSVKPKLGRKDHDIVAEANRNFLSRNAQKLQEWFSLDQQVKQDQQKKQNEQ